MIYDSNTFSELVICNNLFKPGSIRKCLYSGQREIGGKITVDGMTLDPGTSDMNGQVRHSQLAPTNISLLFRTLATF